MGPEIVDVLLKVPVFTTPVSVLVPEALRVVAAMGPRDR